MKNIFITFMLAWLIVCFLFGGWYLMSQEFVYQLLYFYFMLLLFGIPFWFFREKIRDRLKSWKANNLFKFIALCYAAVLFEEIFAALFNHLSEGFNFMLFLQRVGQFWMFNIVSFSGFVFGWYFLIRLFKFSDFEIFYLAGCLGLLAERTIRLLSINIAVFIFMLPMVIHVYGLIITPAMLSIEKQGKIFLHPLIKYPLVLLVYFIFSIIPALILIFLRTNFPGFFPPLEFIPA